MYLCKTQCLAQKMGPGGGDGNHGHKFLSVPLQKVNFILTLCPWVQPGKACLERVHSLCPASVGWKHVPSACPRALRVLQEPTLSLGLCRRCSSLMILGSKLSCLLLR